MTMVAPPASMLQKLKVRTDRNSRSRIWTTKYAPIKTPCLCSNATEKVEIMLR
jgi:hypothetical protein